MSKLGARFGIFESTPTVPSYKIGNFRFLKINNILRFLKIFENVTFRKLPKIEQSNLEARFAIFESFPTVPSYRIGKFRFLKIDNSLRFLKIFEKTLKKNIISRKLQRTEQSYLEARFAIFESTLTGPNYRVENSRFGEKKLIQDF